MASARPAAGFDNVAFEFEGQRIVGTVIDYDKDGSLVVGNPFLEGVWSVPVEEATITKEHITNAPPCDQEPIAMTTYYVATLAKYVLVDSENEADARQRGHVALRELDGDRPIHIRTIRPATNEEIELQRWHQDMVAAEKPPDRRS